MGRGGGETGPHLCMYLSGKSASPPHDWLGSSVRNLGHAPHCRRGVGWGRVGWGCLLGCACSFGECVSCSREGGHHASCVSPRASFLMGRKVCVWMAGQSEGGGSYLCIFLKGTSLWHCARPRVVCAGKHKAAWPRLAHAVLHALWQAPASVGKKKLSSVKGLGLPERARRLFLHGRSIFLNVFPRDFPDGKIKWGFIFSARICASGGAMHSRVKKKNILE